MLCLIALDLVGLTVGLAIGGAVSMWGEVAVGVCENCLCGGS